MRGSTKKHRGDTKAYLQPSFSILQLFCWLDSLLPFPATNLHESVNESPPHELPPTCGSRPTIGKIATTSGVDTSKQDRTQVPTVWPLESQLTLLYSLSKLYKKGGKKTEEFFFFKEKKGKGGTGRGGEGSHLLSNSLLFKLHCYQSSFFSWSLSLHLIRIQAKLGAKCSSLHSILRHSRASSPRVCRQWWP